MIEWDHDRMAAFDVETSGVKKEFSLQPWRVPQNKAWITSLAVVARPDIMFGGLFPTKDQLVEFLRWAIATKRRVVGWNVVFDMAWLIALDLEELVRQVKWLDGMYLWMHLEREPEYETTKGKRKPFGLKQSVAEVLPQHAGYAEDVDFHSRDPEELKKLQAYNYRDTGFTLYCAWHWWQKLTPKQRRCAIIEAETLPDMAAANARGVPVDTLVTRELQQHLTDVAAERLADLAPHGVSETIVRSPKKLGELLFDQWQLPVLKENTGKKTGKVSRATDKEVLHELSFLDPRAKLLRQYRESLNNRTKFADTLLDSADYNGDGRVHMLAIPYGTYCVSGDTEVLTREGWLPIEQWCGGEIMQVRDDLTMSFLPADPHRGAVTDRWVDVPRLGGLFTPEHTMAHLSASRKWTVQTAEDWVRASGYQRNVPVAGQIVGLDGRFSPMQMQLFAAVQADGSFVHRDGCAPALKFTFRKRRKIERLRYLLTALGIQFRDYTPPSYPDRVEITIGARSQPAWLKGDKKQFGPWVLDTTAEGLTAFVDELAFWDGSRRADGGATKYVSYVPGNLIWAQLAAALVGRKANIHADGRTLHISRRGTRTVAKREARFISKKLATYCPVTQTGFWLARRGGCIFVTGNTGRLTYASKQDVTVPGVRPGTTKEDTVPIGFALHQEKRGSMFRSVLKAPAGYDLVEFDAAGQEFRWMAECSGDTTMKTLCMPGEDPHCFMGGRIASIDYRVLMALQEDKNNPGFKAAEQHRYLGKIANFCIAEGSVVLTDRGPCRIEQVRKDDCVWDGVEFVAHDGVVFNGVKSVRTHDGVTATPRHEVLVDGSWWFLEDAARHGWAIEPSLGTGWAHRTRSAVRIVDGIVRRAVSEIGRAVREGALRLWAAQGRQPGVHGDWAIAGMSGVRYAENARGEGTAGDHQRRHASRAEEGQRLVPAVPQSAQQGVSQLRRSGDRVQVRINKGGSRVRHDASPAFDVSPARYRQARQRWSLRAWKSALGYAPAEPAEPTTARVYDIVNCGPRTRYAVNGRIVHNSLAYRTSANKLRVTARVDYDVQLELPEAQLIHGTYRRSYPEVPNYWNRQIALTKARGYVETLAGRRVRVVGDWTGSFGWSMGSTSINHRIQGTGADQKYLALAVLKNLLTTYGAQFAWDLHDGLYFFVPSARTKEFIVEALRRLDHLPYKEAWGYTPSIPMPWDAKWGSSWGTMKKFAA